MSKLTQYIQSTFAKQVDPEELFLSIAGEAGQETLDFAKKLVWAFDVADGVEDGMVSVPGDVKRELAVKAVDALLQAAGVNGISRRLVRALIEQLVLRSISAKAGKAGPVPPSTPVTGQPGRSPLPAFETGV